MIILEVPLLPFLLAFVALLWVVQAVRAWRGMYSLPFLRDAAPAEDSGCPRISILFTARDEEVKLPAALTSMFAQDYPDFEVVAVNDRSRDRTPQILDEFARNESRLKVIHLAELPAGWLGKPHALQKAYEASSGEWLVFTDADVRFAPDLLRRAVPVVFSRGWDHLVLIGLLDLVGFWEKVATIYFGVGFMFGVEPWQVSNPRSGRYMGVGYFQMLRRSAYEAVGTHRRLAMEVVDDMKLGKLVKLGGFRSGVGIAEERIRLRWNDGLGEIVRNVTKNFFAAMDFSIWRIAYSVAGILAISVLPFVALPFTDGLPRLFAALAAGVAVAVHAASAVNYRVRWMYGLTHPLGALIFCYMLLRSTVVTLWQGGIVWRDTFYPLSDLRKGMV